MTLDNPRETILIVDDFPATIKALVGKLQEEYNVVTAYEFALDTGSARIILLFSRAFWEENDAEFIL